MTEEIWKAVVGFEDAYEVSNLGRVRSLSRSWQQISRHGTAYTYRKQGKILAPGRMSGGHLSVVLGREAGSFCVHDLVLSAFVGPRPPKHEGRHLDGVHENNRFDNLVWDTRGNNNRDKKWHDGCRQYKLKPEEVRFIKQKSLPYDRWAARTLAAKFNVSKDTIYLIRQGKIHTDVSA